MLTIELIEEIARKASLEIVDVNLHPYGRDWQAIVYFTEEFGISLLYKYPYLTPMDEEDFSFGLVKRDSSADEGFSLLAEDYCTYDIDMTDLVGNLNVTIWDADIPYVLF